MRTYNDCHVSYIKTFITVLKNFKRKIENFLENRELFKNGMTII